MRRKQIRSLLTSITVFLLLAGPLRIPVLSANVSTHGKAKIVSTVFSNTQPIAINTTSGLTVPTPASAYPSTIEVSGMTGTTTKVEVSLRGVNHTLGQMDMLLVSPTGAKFVFLSDSNAVGQYDAFYTFSDSGATTLLQPSQGLSGTYLPTDLNTGTDTFPAPAPAGPYNVPASSTFASVFNGADPNGAWNLYAVDDTLFTPGEIISGWSLNITTNGSPQTFANTSYISFNDIVAPASPYGSPITVSGQTGAIANLKVTLTGFSHQRPSDVDMLLVSPNGKSLVLMSDAGGSNSVTDANLTFDDAASSGLPSTIVSGTYRPTDLQQEADFFPSPAPLIPYLSGGAQLSNFNGFSPNGEWRLFITDDSQTQSGSISGGWSLEITMGPIPQLPPASCSAAVFSPTSFPAGVSPTNLVIVDLNNDMKPDLAVTNQVSNDISILLGNGNGTFQPQTLVGAGSGPYGIVAGKFNADNNYDLAVTNSGANTVSIYLGNGDGTFAAPLNFFVGASPISIASADFNNDGKADLVVANFGSFFAGSVSVLLGTGTGTFVAGPSIRTRTQPSFVATGLLNADGNQDVIVANFGSDSVSTFFGNGSGSFQLSQNLSTGQGPVALELNDLGQDGIADLVVANYNGDSLTTCTGNANGLFTSCSSSYAGGANPISVAVADFLGSGIRTSAVALSGSSLVRVYANDIPVGQNPNAIRVTDFNNDGKPDVVAANYGSNDVTVLINGCQVAKGNIFDFNGDRRTDYSTFRPSTSNWYVQALNSSGSVLKFGRPNDTILSADFDGDRNSDFAYYRPESGLWFILDRFSRPIYFTQFGLPDDIPVPADYDGDGKADIAVWRPSDGNWYIRRSSDNSINVIPFGSSGDKPAPGDFDGDGIDDVGIYRPSTGVWYILRSSDSQFTIRQFGISEDLTVVGDYDGDGKADIAVFRPSTSVWYVLKSSDDDFLAVAWGTSGDRPVIGDFEGDGKYDMGIWRESDKTWYIRKSSDGGGIYYPWGSAGDIPVPNVFVR